MPIIRNPFRRAPGEHVNDENAKPASNTTTTTTSYLPSGLLGRRTESENSISKSMSIDLAATDDASEFKLSEINDSGVYLPPSPSETHSFWSMKPTYSRRSSSNNHRNVLSENEPFNISRESFDSYRRSFDISARSPVLETSPTHRSRQSLEARSMRFPSTHSFSTLASYTSMRSHSLSQHPSQRSVTTLSSRYTADPASPKILPIDDTAYPPSLRVERMSIADDGPISEEPGTDEAPEVTQVSSKAKTDDSKEPIPEPDSTDRFEDIVLHDPKPKRGLFARFGVGSSSSSSNNPNATDSTDAAKTTSSSSHSFFGRKRGGSGQGAELNSIRRPTSRGPASALSTTMENGTTAGAIARPKTPVMADKGPVTRPKTPTIGERIAANIPAGLRTPVQADKTAGTTSGRSETPVQQTAKSPAPLAQAQAGTDRSATPKPLPAGTAVAIAAVATSTPAVSVPAATRKETPVMPATPTTEDTTPITEATEVIPTSIEQPTAVGTQEETKAEAA